MSSRSYIENDEKIILYGESDGKRFSRTFTIKERLNKGGASAVCYSAQYDESGLGVLKEFYPNEFENLKRNENNQLIYCGENREKTEFIKRLKSFIQPYNMLLKVRNQLDLATFISHFEVYYTDNSNGTIYIWTPVSELETFESLCNGIHNNPTENSERQLLTAMNAVKELLKCVCAIHKAELLHGDIKPSNFGFQKRGDEILVETIQMFDVDTICSVYEISEKISFSKGFDAPELYETGISNLTDIYAIGATLFNAVIVTSETAFNDYFYSLSFFDKLESLVNESELLNSCSDMIHPKFRGLLSNILKKSLCGANERYQSCEEMLEDVTRAIYYITPFGSSDGERYVLTDAEQLLDTSTITQNFMYHLYNYPVYEKTSDKSKYIEFMMIGFGKHSQKFLDIVLQIVQMPGKRLNVTVISDSAEDKEIYLSQRPELSDFFNVDGSLADENESYGNINFVVHSFSKTGEKRNMEFISEYKADYIFVSVGSDDFNLSLAKTLNVACYVCVPLERNKVRRGIPENIIPIYITKNISNEPFFAELERMAFNVHLIWQKNLNVEYSDIRKEYRKPYNHYSCVSFVLSIKYKLYGIGIKMEGNLSEVAKEYLAYIKENREKKNELIMLEHRRWVAEKLCLGYTRIVDLNECASGKTKNEKKKRHVCIVKSRGDSLLSSKPWVKGKSRILNKEKWDNPSEAELNSLDELERMSVELHLMYKKYAESESANNLLSGEFVSALHKSVERDVSAIVALQELFTCMKDISNNDSAQVRRYKGLKKTFLDTVKESVILTAVEKNSIKQLMNSLHERFVPIFESQQYRNYKLDDLELIEGIPFILTYSSELYMVIPFVTGSNNNGFSNIASAITVNPYKIVFLASCSKRTEIENVKKALPYISEFMVKKKLRASINFIIECTDGLKVSDAEKIEKEFSQLSSKRVQNVRFINSEYGTEYVEYIEEYVDIQLKKGHKVIIEKNSSPVSRMMGLVGMYKRYPTYSFNSSNSSFNNINACSAIEYIRFKPYLTVSDMFAFNLSTSTTSNKPEFYEEYDELWKQYKNYTAEWKQMCKCFKDYFDEKDVIAVFSRKNAPHNIYEYTYIIPFLCKEAVSKILDALISQKLIADDSYIAVRNTGSCKVVIKDIYGSRRIYDSLMSELYKLMQSDYIKCEINPKDHVVKICYNNLSAYNVDCKKLNAKGYELIKFLHEKKYLINLSVERNTGAVTFTYATPQIKELLTSEGKLLEIYIYHKAKETGKFDDIRSGFEINWENNVASNEFDCVLTKGLNSLFIECKATNNLRSDYYTKLYALADKFGINATVVLIADTVDNDNTCSINEKMRKTGEGFDIITLSDRADIDNIGEKLFEILKNRIE